MNPAADDVCFDSVDADCDGSTGCDKTDADSSRELIGEAAENRPGRGIEGAVGRECGRGHGTSLALVPSTRHIDREESA